MKNIDSEIIMTIPFDQRNGKIWFNGKLVNWNQANIHYLSHALHYASSVFEGERAYNGKIFKLQEHTERLFFSAETLGMKIPFTHKEINKATKDALIANNITDGYIRPLVWRGSESMQISAQTTKIHVAIACWEWPSYFSPEAKMKGLKLMTSEWKRPSPETAPVHAKAAGLYMICTLSKNQAEAKGYNDAMLLDYRGYISEATGANMFFLMEDGKIHTPLPDCFLNGITRRTVIELAKKCGFEVIERHIMPQELAQVSECFLTGTAAEVTPIGSIDEFNFNPGGCCKTLIDAYAKEVRAVV